MPYEATLIYSDKLVRSAVFAFWRRSIGVGFGVAFAVVAAGFGAALWRGDRSWLVGVFGTLLGVAAAFVVAIYAVHYRNAIAKLRQMPSLRATFIADEQHFTVSSEIGSSTLAWGAVQELWCFENYWLLLFSKAQFSTLPLTCLPSDMQAFIRARVQAAGGKVVD